MFMKEKSKKKKIKKYSLLFFASSNFQTIKNEQMASLNANWCCSFLLYTSICMDCEN